MTKALLLCEFEIPDDDRPGETLQRLVETVKAAADAHEVPSGRGHALIGDDAVGRVMAAYYQECTPADRQD